MATYIVKGNNRLRADMEKIIKNQFMKKIRIAHPTENGQGM